MQLLIIFLPLLGFFSGSLLGRILGLGVCVITTSCTFCSFLLSFHLFLDVLNSGNVYKISMGDWMPIESLNVEWCFLFDSLTAVMLIVVTSISTLVHLYSTSYMEKDPHLTRFMSYLSLFTFFMLILVTANNFLQMFVGWEGVGLSSFLLINFWFTRIQANKAAIKAMLINRIGDFFLLLAMFSIYYICNSLDYDTVFLLVPLINNYTFLIYDFEIAILDIICIFLFLGAMGKSAQLGLHTWLPDAMEGPTPVSALIHAATMVTAGVFLLARCSFLFEYSPLALNIIAYVGASTAFFASTTGLFQNDLKKVIAYSTCSQLGYMIFACGLSGYDVGLFHLFNHAFFKALLFLGAGSVIHAVSDEQDMRKMGGLKNLLPFSYCCMLIGSLALIGFPFLAGFYSKDTILELAYAKQSISGLYCYYLGTFAAFFTAFYSTRLLFLVFLAEPNGNRTAIINAHEGNWQLTFPLLFLAFLSIFIGYLAKDFFICFGTHYWNNALFILPNNYGFVDLEFIDNLHRLLPLMLTIAGASFAYFTYNVNMLSYFQTKKTVFFKVFYTFLNKKWYIDKLYNTIVGQPLLAYSYQFSYKDIDRGILEVFGPKGITETLIKLSKTIKIFQSGNIFHYLYMFFVSILIILTLTFLSINFITLFLIVSLLFVFLS